MPLFQNIKPEGLRSVTWMTNCPKCPSILLFHISANVWIGIQAQCLNLNVAWFQIWISNMWHKSVPHISHSIRSQASPIQRNFLISYIIFFFWEYKENKRKHLRSLRNSCILASGCLLPHSFCLIFLIIFFFFTSSLFLIFSSIFVGREGESF